MSGTAQQARLLKAAMADVWPAPEGTMDQHIAEARRDMGEVRWAELQAEGAGDPAPRGLDQHISCARHEMGEARWAELNKGWEHLL